MANNDTKGKQHTEDTDYSIVGIMKNIAKTK